MSANGEPRLTSTADATGATPDVRPIRRGVSRRAFLKATGVLIVGVSVDSAQSHKDFCAKEGLNFKLLADPEAKVSTEYGSVMEYQGAKMAARMLVPHGAVIGKARMALVSLKLWLSPGWLSLSR